MIVEILEDKDDMILPIPDEIMEELGLEIGDTLEFIDNGDNTFTLRKKE